MELVPTGYKLRGYCLKSLAMKPKLAARPTGVGVNVIAGEELIVLFNSSIAEII